ncbi:hypothetical protein BJY00DRAFT_287251 [Aspergillus carlsbadensis]|nr:hypothetical protein BJY00DRAFT_287251 [Aspergillus carlsbadensis]
MSVNPRDRLQGVMDQGPPPMRIHDSGPALMKGIWVGMAVAIIVVILRVIAKIRIRHFRLDDVLMIAALTLSLTSTAFLTISIDHGFGGDLRTGRLSDVQMVLKCIAIQWPLLTMSTTLARCSFICYLAAILASNRVHQVLLWATLSLQLAANIVSAVLPTTICRNVEVLWKQHVVTSCGDTTAVIKFSYFTGSLTCPSLPRMTFLDWLFADGIPGLNSAVDLFLAVFATVVFWNLNLALRIKISLVTLLSLGIVAMVASIIKTTKLDAIPSITNLGASGGASFFRWGYAENAIIIFTSSVPCLRSLAISSVRKIQNGHGATRSYALTSWPFSRSHHTRSQPHNHADASNCPGRENNIYHHGQVTDSIERIFDLETRQAPHASAQSEQRGEAPFPPAQLNIRITKQVQISYHGPDLR